MIENNYLKIIERRDRIRYYLLGTYFILLIGLTIGSISTGFEVGVRGYLTVIYAGFVFIIILLIYPYFRPVQVPIIEDTVGIDLTESYLETTYSEVVRVKILAYLTIPFGILFTILGIPFVLNGHVGEAIAFFGSAIFFFGIFALFEKLVIEGTDGGLLVKLGPIKQTIEYDQIISSRPTHIKWFKSYLGIGKRISTDGTIGYITGTSSGVRLEMRTGRALVISSENPKVLVAFLRKMKSGSVWPLDLALDN